MEWVYVVQCRFVLVCVYVSYCEWGVGCESGSCKGCVVIV